MSDLQIGLAIIGALVVAAVIAYNKWQEARLERRADRSFASPHDDVLMRRGDDSGSGAGQTIDPEAEPLVPPPRTERVEHTMEPIDIPAPRPAVDAARGAPAHVPLDPMVDCIVVLECAKPASGADVLTHSAALIDEALLKPVHWEGFDSAAGGWGPVLTDQRYGQLRAGLQLANRAGPATEEDVGAFLGAIQEVALALVAQPAYPDPDDAVGRAKQLDVFCADMDVQIGLNVIATSTTMFAGTKLRALAESGGLQLGKDGRFHRVDDRGAELFALANMEPMPFHAETMKTLATRGVTALLDVPRAPGSSSTFRLYLDFARQLEQALGGMLVDDNKKPIGQAALEQIAAQLEHIHRSMDEHGIPAGGPLALRLFS